MSVLIVARILQGVAGAGILAASLGAIGHAFPTGHRRALATSVWGSSVGAGIAIGPLAAGALAASLGWRSSFWLEAIAAAALIAAAAGIEESRAGDQALARSPGRGRAGPRDGRPDRRADRGPPELVGARNDRSARRRRGSARPRSSPIELRTREPMLELGRFKNPLFLASLVRRAIHRPGRDRPDELHPAAPPARPRRQRDRQRRRARGVVGRRAWRSRSRRAGCSAAGAPPRSSCSALRSRPPAEFALAGLGVGSSWTRLLPGLVDPRRSGAGSSTPRSAGSRSSRCRASARAWAAARTTPPAISAAPPASRSWSRSRPAVAATGAAGPARRLEHGGGRVRRPLPGRGADRRGVPPRARVRRKSASAHPHRRVVIGSVAHSRRQGRANRSFAATREDRSVLGRSGLRGLGWCRGYLERTAMKRCRAVNLVSRQHRDLGLLHAPPGRRWRSSGHRSKSSALDDPCAPAGLRVRRPSTLSSTASTSATTSRRSSSSRTSPARATT